MKALRIRVSGEPKAQPRPRAMKRGDHISIYNPSSAEIWKRSILAALKSVQFEKFNMPVEVSIIYYLKRPTSLMRKSDSDDIIIHSKKPDLDNLNKAVLDSITKAEVWNDDSQVHSLASLKYYAKKDNSNMGAYIEIRECLQ